MVRFTSLSTAYISLAISVIFLVRLAVCSPSDTVSNTIYTSLCIISLSLAFLASVVAVISPTPIGRLTGEEYGISALSLCLIFGLVSLIAGYLLEDVGRGFDPDIPSYLLSPGSHFDPNMPQLVKGESEDDKLFEKDRGWKTYYDSKGHLRLIEIYDRDSPRLWEIDTFDENGVSQDDYDYDERGKLVTATHHYLVDPDRTIHYDEWGNPESVYVDDSSPTTLGSVDGKLASLTVPGPAYSPCMWVGGVLLGVPFLIILGIIVSALAPVGGESPASPSSNSGPSSVDNAASTAVGFAAGYYGTRAGLNCCGCSLSILILPIMLFVAYLLIHFV
jgi:hypothetical protein